MKRTGFSQVIRVILLTAGLAATGLANAQANLLANGDFSGGNTGFVSSYTHSGDLFPEGTYAVTDNPSSVHSAFLTTLGSTGPGGSGGNVMVVNGATAAGAMVWGEQVTMQAGVPHDFAGWITTVLRSDAAPSQLNVELSTTPGTCGDAGLTYDPVTTLTATASGPEWVETTAAGVTRGAAGSYCLRMVNNQVQPGGNDFALDDLSFTAQAVVGVPTLEVGGLAALSALIGLGWLRQRRRSA